MAKPSYLAQPVIHRLPAILEEIADGTLAIPKFQRPFVWTDEQRMDLMDSIRRGMPIGALLVWRTSEHKLETYQQLGPFRLPLLVEHELRTYVLDGHQRLSTLYGALHEAGDDTENDEVDRVRWPIYYDLEGDEFLWPRRTAAPRTWLKMSLVFNPIDLYTYQKELIDIGHADLARKAENIANKFKDYQLAIVPLVTEDLKQVTETFQRVNSTGTTMSEVDMVRALMWSTEFDLGDRLGQVAEQLADIGWEGLGHQILLDTIKMFYDFDVCEPTPEETIGALRSDPSLLDELAVHIKHAVVFLSQHCWTNGPAVLPYKYQLAILADAARILDSALEGDVADALRLWFWRTTYTEYFAGMTGTQIRRAAQHVRAIVTGAIPGDEMPPELSREVRPLGRFNYVSARSRALVLLLVQRDPCDEHGKPMLAADLVGLAGDRVIPMILSAKTRHPFDVRRLSDGPENRWIVAPGHARALYQALFQPPGQARDALLDSHAITEAACQALARGDDVGFLAARRERLVELERAFVTSLGLTYGDPP
jgi:hypothetical protein